MVSCRSSSAKVPRETGIVKRRKAKKRMIPHLSDEVIISIYHHRVDGSLTRVLEMKNPRF